VRVAELEKENRALRNSRTQLLQRVAIAERRVSAAEESAQRAWNIAAWTRSEKRGGQVG